jgi:hypothetical protein
MQGTREPGNFCTTVDATDGTTAVCLNKGAVLIIVLDGGSIVDCMIDERFAVTRPPIELCPDGVDR